MLPPTVAMFLICGDAVSDDAHAVADGQRLGRQHLFIRHQKRRGRVARAVEIHLRRLLRQRAAEIPRHILRLRRVDAQHLCMRIRAAHQLCIHHARHAQIVRILPRAERLFKRFKARRFVVHHIKSALFHHCCASFPFAYSSMIPDAATMASSIFVYPVQRHRFPDIAAWISSRVG